MKSYLFVLALCLLLTMESCLGQVKPIPRGVREAEQAEQQSEKDIPPPAKQTLPVDMAKLEKDANELATLAQAIPSEISQVTRGALPKDLIEKLHRVEKLSKHLRNELTR